MKKNTLLIIGVAVVAYFLFTKTSSGKDTKTVTAPVQSKVNEGFAVANSIYGSVSQIWA